MKVEHRQIVEWVRPARRLLVDGHTSFRSCARAPFEGSGGPTVAKRLAMDDPQLKIVLSRAVTARRAVKRS